MGGGRRCECGCTYTVGWGGEVNAAEEGEVRRGTHVGGRRGEYGRGEVSMGGGR